MNSEQLYYVSIIDVGLAGLFGFLQWFTENENKNY